MELAAACAALASFQGLTQQADTKASMLLALHVGLGAVTATQARWPGTDSTGEAPFLSVLIVMTALVYLLCFCTVGCLLSQVVLPRIDTGVTGRFALAAPPVERDGQARVPHAPGSRYSEQAWDCAEAVARIATLKYRLVGRAVSWTAVMIITAALWFVLSCLPV